MKEVTIRWMLEDGATVLPWLKDHHRHKSIDMVCCSGCYKKPPEERSFIVLCDRAYCQTCLKKHLAETEPHELTTPEKKKKQ